MANAKADVANLLMIAKLIKNDEIKTLRIQQRKSGENKGKLWIEWTTKPTGEEEYTTRMERQRIAETITKAATLISEGKEIVFELFKASAVLNRYNLRLEVLKA